ncbi:hypothetical protein ACFFV7_35720 [Nonomuraea spiralis]|uniref:Tetracyclin repressor SlmA-like C-terminal domain-containing protein n=1 Tax=Nonomuraea spiralis TaxID=46182 RepID=A0ABV5IS81_9ACTN|nr:hypothetical protein [Nonomuraea spiralis]GGT31797.1 putative transcriptional regulator, TetR family protein [Nonomuraea spiralis]
MRNSSARVFSRHGYASGTTDRIAEVLAEPRPASRWVPELTRALVRMHAEDPRLHQVLFEQAPRPQELLARFRQVEGEAVAAVTRLLRADPDLSPGDPERRARFVIAMIESLVHRFSGDPVQAADLEGEITAIATGYLYREVAAADR